MAFAGNIGDYARELKDLTNRNHGKHCNDNKHSNLEERILFPDDIGRNFDDYSRTPATWRKTNPRETRTADKQLNLDDRSFGMHFDDYSRTPASFTHTNTRIEDRIVFPDDSILTSRSKQAYMNQEKSETKFSVDVRSATNKNVKTEPVNDRIVFPDD